MRFEKRTAVITGGASGMGLLCGKRFAREGARVVLADVDREKLDAAVREIQMLGGEATGLEADVRDYGQAQRVCDEAVRRYGSLDLLVCCAGGASSRIFECHRPFHEYPVEYLDWGIDVNLKGPMYFSRAAMPQMVKQRSGVILLLGSITGAEGSPWSVDYSAAKSALMNGLLRSLAQSGAPHGIRVCAVSPGPVLTRPAMAGMQTLLGRAAQPEEIVELILYLCSDRAAFITGSNFMVDGGRQCLTDEALAIRDGSE